LIGVMDLQTQCHSRLANGKPIPQIKTTPHS
jgi:hypothetical protein